MPRRNGRSLDHDEDSSSSSSSNSHHGSDNRASYGSSCGIKSVNEYQHKLLREKQVQWIWDVRRSSQFEKDVILTYFLSGLRCSRRSRVLQRERGWPRLGGGKVLGKEDGRVQRRGLRRGRRNQRRQPRGAEGEG